MTYHTLTKRIVIAIFSRIVYLEQMAKFNGLLHRKRADNGAMMGYIEQMAYAHPPKVLTKEEIQKLYPDVTVRLRKETEEESKARVLKNARMRGAALRKKSNLTWK